MKIVRNCKKLIFLTIVILCTTGCATASPELIVESVPSVVGTPQPAVPTSTAVQVSPTAVEEAVQRTAPPTAAPAAATLEVIEASAGSVEPCRLPIATFSNVGLGVPRPTGFTTSTGSVQAVVLFADFDDAPANETPAETFARVSPGAADFFNQISYGRMTLDLQPHLTWLRLSQPSAHYAGLLSSGDGHRAFIQEAVDLADPDVDYSNADLVVVLANPAPPRSRLARRLALPQEIKALRPMALLFPAASHQAPTWQAGVICGSTTKWDIP